MTISTVLAILAIAVVGTVATVAICLGLLNWMGAFYVVHCKECRHLTGSTVNEPSASCPQCRHPVLFHPIYASRHHDAPVRVRQDALHY